MGQLRKLASKLAERYPWETADAAWFVLTGEPPWVPPLTATSSGPDLAKNHGTITIRAAHWVSEEAVSDLYLKMKSRMHPTHTTSQRRLTLFRFVTERSSGVNKLDRGGLVTGLRTPPWRSLQPNGTRSTRPAKSGTTATSETFAATSWRRPNCYWGTESVLLLPPWPLS